MSNYLRNLEKKDSYSDVNLNSTIYDNSEASTSKSKLQELKQLSVEKLAILKQKLIEAKNQTLGESLQCYGKYKSNEMKINSIRFSVIYLIVISSALVSH